MPLQSFFHAQLPITPSQPRMGKVFETSELLIDKDNDNNNDKGYDNDNNRNDGDDVFVFIGMISFLP